MALRCCHPRERLRRRSGEASPSSDDEKAREKKASRSQKGEAAMRGIANTLAWARHYASRVPFPNISHALLVVCDLHEAVWLEWRAAARIKEFAVMDLKAINEKLEFARSQQVPLPRVAAALSAQCDVVDELLRVIQQQDAALRSMADFLASLGAEALALPTQDELDADLREGPRYEVMRPELPPEPPPLPPPIAREPPQGVSFRPAASRAPGFADPIFRPIASAVAEASAGASAAPAPAATAEIADGGLVETRPAGGTPEAAGASGEAVAVTAPTEPAPMTPGTVLAAELGAETKPVSAEDVADLFPQLTPEELEAERAEREARSERERNEQR